MRRRSPSGEPRSWRAASGTAPPRPNVSEQSSKSRLQNKGFETELAGLREVRDALSAKLTVEQWATTESNKRTEELENRLRENTAELERVKADADRHAQERARLESELHAQLNAAKSAA